MHYIKKLIKLDIVFADTYVYTSSLFNLEDLLFREIIVRNPENEVHINSYQSHEERLAYFHSILDKRMQMIGNTSAYDLVFDAVTNEGYPKNSKK